MKNLKIYTKNIEQTAKEQIDKLLEQEVFSNSKVRIMPDVHAGSGCVIGFTADLGNKVIPNIVGVDIGCGMLTVELGKIDIDFKKLDEVINEYIPSGFETHQEEQLLPFDLKKLYMYDNLKNIDRIKKSIGTLGGGNHFIEIDEDDEKNKYLVIHSGSRNLGHQVASYYQKLAIKTLNEISLERRNEVIDSLKKQGKQKEISKALKKLKPLNTIPNELCYLEGIQRTEYLHDMKLCQKYALVNRERMANMILNKMDWIMITSWQTIHNYIGEDNIVRKGAISAYKNEKVLIPINMRDGCIVGIGKGNGDWNYSAPHGAGRIMGRAKAKEKLSMNDFKESMKNIYTTSVVDETLDEAPMAYKPIEEIIKNIGDTIEIKTIIKPIYNYKAH